ncbi:MAG: sigma factor-like helix-turn-helix DNA-binding protein [Polyangiaceae bacterium]
MSPQLRDKRKPATASLLSADERSAFVLRHLKGLQLEEVAEALEISLATAGVDCARIS